MGSLFPEIEPRSPTLQADSLPTEPQGKPKNTRVGCHSLLQRIFSTQGSNPGLLHYRQIFLPSELRGKPKESWAFHKFAPSVQFSLVTQSCPILCDPMDCSTSGFPVHHQLLDPTQTHVHHFGFAIQPSHPLSSRSPPIFSLSQHQSLFQ